MSAGVFSRERARQMSFSLADQALAVGGTFLINVLLARTQPREVYGVFALCYSVYTFLTGIHNALIVETYTVYGSGRYHRHFSSYSRLLWLTNLALVAAIAVALGLAWRVLTWVHVTPGSSTILGLAIACSAPLSALFLRRTFYLRRRPDLAARFSLISFATCAVLAWLSLHFGRLTGLNAFLIIGLAWTLAAVLMANELPRTTDEEDFLEAQPQYWKEHWKYSRWVLITAFVFQLTSQGYYWLAAGLVSVREVANLRAMLNIVIPLDQVFTATNLLVLPMLCVRFETAKISGLLPAWRNYCLGWLAVTCAFAGGVLLLGRPAMHILYGGAYDDIAGLVGTLAFLPVVMGVGHTINAALKSAERPDFVFAAYLCSGVGTLAVGIPLITHLGLRGAVYGLLFSGAVYTIVLAFGLLRIALARPQGAAAYPRVRSEP